MPLPAACGFHHHFADLPDPRVDRTKRHALLDIITIALCAVVCGADSRVEVERFGCGKLPWLRTFLALPNGIPSHDTFGRVFTALDPLAFEQGFLGWVQALLTATEGRVVAIDGKTLRRSHDRATGHGPLHLVSAWATTNGVVLGQVAVDDEANEIVAIPALLDALRLQDTVITIDAMGCQTEIDGRIIQRGADYVLALKDNQPTLHELVRYHFSLSEAGASTGHRTIDKNHGRLEVRCCWATDDLAVLTWLDPEGVWPGLRTIAAVEGERRSGAAVTVERRYYLSSLPADTAQITKAVRNHWGIENSLHWVLDMGFREDESRVCSGLAAENLAVLRDLALNLLRRETTAKVGIEAKRLMCGWDETISLKSSQRKTRLPWAYSLRRSTANRYMRNYAILRDATILPHRLPALGNVQ
jgi:predicted transposase YbfD/YdcC